MLDAFILICTVCLVFYIVYSLMYMLVAKSKKSFLCYATQFTLGSGLIILLVYLQEDILYIQGFICLVALMVCSCLARIYLSD
jgi:hypothetical protein